MVSRFLKEVLSGSGTSEADPLSEAASLGQPSGDRPDSPERGRPGQFRRLVPGSEGTRYSPQGFFRAPSF